MSPSGYQTEAINARKIGFWVVIYKTKVFKIKQQGNCAANVNIWWIFLGENVWFTVACLEFMLLSSNFLVWKPLSCSWNSQILYKGCSIATLGKLVMLLCKHWCVINERTSTDTNLSRRGDTLIDFKFTMREQQLSLYTLKLAFLYSIINILSLFLPYIVTDYIITFFITIQM